MMVAMFDSILLFWFFTSRPQSTVCEIVSPSVIVNGQIFTVTCDASRAGVPATATTMTTLSIAWTAQTSQEPETLARYRIYLSPYTFQPQISPARNWTFAFTGSQQGTSDTPNNRNTMKIEMVVYDAKCTDAGVYYCNAWYIDFQGDVVSINQYQNISSYARVDPLSLTLVPQFPGQEPDTSVNPAGSNATLACNLYGPKVIAIQWKYGHSSSEVKSFTSYPVQNDISVAEPVLVSSGTTCVKYRHTSTLKFQTEDMYDGYMYVCVATENNEDTIVGNMTIYTKPGRSNASNRRPSESMSNAFCPSTDNDGYMLPVRTVDSHGNTRDAAGVRESTVSADTHGPKLGDEQHVYSSIDDPIDAQFDCYNDDIDFHRTQNSAVANIDDSHLDETACENHNTANVYDTLERNLDSQTDNHYLSPTF